MILSRLSGLKVQAIAIAVKTTGESGSHFCSLHHLL